MNYIEKDCTVTHKDRTFEAGGAVVTPDYIVAYLAKDGVLKDWHGKVLGSYKITATWKTPRSFISSEQHQVTAYVCGVRYTGRSGGIGLSYRGKRIAKQ